MNIIKNIITLLYTAYFHGFPLSFSKSLGTSTCIQVYTNKYQKQSFTKSIHITYLVKEKMELFTRIS